MSGRGKGGRTFALAPAASRAAACAASPLMTACWSLVSPLEFFFSILDAGTKTVCSLNFLKAGCYLRAKGSVWCVCVHVVRVESRLSTTECAKQRPHTHTTTQSIQPRGNRVCWALKGTKSVETRLFTLLNAVALYMTRGHSMATPCHGLSFRKTNVARN